MKALIVQCVWNITGLENDGLNCPMCLKYHWTPKQAFVITWGLVCILEFLLVYTGIIPYFPRHIYMNREKYECILYSQCYQKQIIFRLTIRWEKKLWSVSKHFIELRYYYTYEKSQIIPCEVNRCLYLSFPCNGYTFCLTDCSTSPGCVKYSLIDFVKTIDTKYVYWFRKNFFHMCSSIWVQQCTSHQNDLWSYIQQPVLAMLSLFTV
jgi:hypothetical protein